MGAEISGDEGVSASGSAAAFGLFLMIFGFGALARRLGAASVST